MIPDFPSELLHEAVRAILPARAPLSVQLAETRRQHGRVEHDVWVWVSEAAMDAHTDRIRTLARHVAQHIGARVRVTVRTSTRTGEPFVVGGA